MFHYIYVTFQEILLCGVGFKNDVADRRVILYLNNCDCGRKHCQENAALIVKNHLKKVNLKDTAMEFLIEYLSLSIYIYVKYSIEQRLIFDV